MLDLATDSRFVGLSLLPAKRWFSSLAMERKWIDKATGRPSDNKMALRKFLVIDIIRRCFQKVCSVSATPVFPKETISAIS